MGPIFWLSSNFWVFAKTLKIAKFLKNEPIFQEKTITTTIGTHFCQNDPYRWVWGLRLERYTPSKPNLSTPQGWWARFGLRATIWKPLKYICNPWNKWKVFNSPETAVSPAVVVAALFSPCVAPSVTACVVDVIEVAVVAVVDAVVVVATPAAAA